MSKGDTTENDVIKIMFLSNYDPTWRTNANLYLALHTADPTDSGDQTSFEVSAVLYVSYARIPIVKTAVGWTIAGNQAQNAALAAFPQCTGGAGTTAKYVSIGTLSAGAGQILYSGQLNADLAISNLIQPQFQPLALTITED
jgi:hypothetical protein